MTRSDGFTLLEVLVAITLTSLLMFFGYEMFISLEQAEQATLDENERDRLAEIVLDRMEREIVGTLLVKLPQEVERGEHPWVFLARDGVLDGQDADALRFVTETPARVGGGAELPDGYRMVTYVPLADSETGRMALYRAEETLPQGLELDLPSFDNEPVVRDVVRFDIRPIDDETPAPVQAWDSSSEAQEDRLPSAIDLTLQLASTSRLTGERTPGVAFTRRIPLFVRPIGEGDDENGASGSEDCQGPTVGECLDRFAEVLQALGPAAEGAVESLTQGVDRSACFASDTPEPAVEALSQQLVALTQLDPQEICR